MRSFLSTLLLSGLAVASSQPNILFVLTDDQDKHMGSPEYMPKLQKQVAQLGTNYHRHYCANALCCPSRANIWTGRMPHNTNVTDVNPPYGGFPKVVEAGWNDNYLPLWMQEAGYNTYYVGKLWNAHSTTYYNTPYPRGFNSSDFLLDPNTYRYYDAIMTRNGAKPKSYRGQYSTDVISDKAAGFLDEALSHKDQPWMLTVAPTAPHSNGSYDPTRDTNWFGDPEYPDRYDGLFKDYKIPRDASFNKPIQGAVGWVKDLTKLNDTLVQYNDEFQRKRLRALQSVDEMIGKLVDKLDKAGALSNTYIFFAADNGYHISQHQMNPGKNCGYETDINVPLYVRGPGVGKNATVDVITSHTDLAPTFLHIAGAPNRPGLDGKRLPFTVEETKDSRREHAAIEYWGMSIPEGIYGHYSNVPVQPGMQFKNNTYKSLRLIGDGYNVYYSVWCSNEKELFDLNQDPHQTVNIAANPKNHADFQIANRPIDQVIPRLDALMMVLKSCDGDACREPWKQLHPGGKVQSLTEALDEQYDGFYQRQVKVSFSSCANGYIISEEGPQKFNVYTGGKASSGSKKRGLLSSFLEM